MNDVLHFFGPWLLKLRYLAARGRRQRLKRGEYGNAALYREWRLTAEQQADNKEGRFAKVRFHDRIV